MPSESWATKPLLDAGDSIQVCPTTSLFDKGLVVRHDPARPSVYELAKACWLTWLNGAAARLRDMREPRAFVLTWFAVVGLITLAVVPVRLYVLSQNDWLVGTLTTIGFLFMLSYFLIAWLWKPKTV